MSEHYRLRRDHLEFFLTIRCKRCIILFVSETGLKSERESPLGLNTAVRETRKNIAICSVSFLFR